MSEANTHKAPLVIAAEKLMFQLEPEPEHVLQVRKNAVRLFELFANRLHLDGDSLPILEAAALLHDIGWSVSGKGHHKHSAKLILSHGLPGSSERELKLIASLARAHRKSVPCAKHMPYGSLGGNDQDLIRKLAALVRIADGLDRSHCSRVQDIDIYDDNQHCLVLIVKSVWPLEVEKFGFAKKKGLLEELLGVELRLEVHDVHEGD